MQLKLGPYKRLEIEIGGNAMISIEKVPSLMVLKISSEEICKIKHGIWL